MQFDDILSENTEKIENFIGFQRKIITIIIIHQNIMKFQNKLSKNHQNHELILYLNSWKIIQFYQNREIVIEKS